MPCHSYNDADAYAMTLEQFNKVERALCAVLTAAEASGTAEDLFKSVVNTFGSTQPELITEIRTWWLQHKADDAHNVRYAIERALEIKTTKETVEGMTDAQIAASRPLGYSDPAGLRRHVDGIMAHSLASLHVHLDDKPEAQLVVLGVDEEVTKALETLGLTRDGLKKLHTGRHPRHAR